MKIPASLLALALTFQPAFATWSVVAADSATGEVVVASATCLPNMDLLAALPAVVPGVGAGAVQSSVDPGAQRLAIWNMLQQGQSPQQILNTIAIPQHQYGVVNLLDPSATYTSANAGAAATGRVGQVGTITYAIQGNVLAGKKVIGQAEQAFVGTSGDLSQRVMAAMEAARLYGGDGRCSCSVGNPNGCGSPPPSFTHSAYTGFIVLARVGDTLGVCNGNKGCANGNYYLDINVVANKNFLDPVLTLNQRYATWRALLSGRPDGILSVVDAGADSMPADGVTTTPVTIQLVDIDGLPLTSGGASLKLNLKSSQPAVTVPGEVTDHGDGSYSFDLTAGSTPGTDTWRIVVDDAKGRLVRLYPDLELRVDPVDDLHVGLDQVSATTGDWVPLTLNPGVAGSFYRLLASGSGTAPGTPFQGTLVPLVRDPLMTLVSQRANTSLAPSTRGFLDASGRASAAFSPPPGMLTAYVGARIEWSALFYHPGGVATAAPRGFDVVP